MLAEQQFMKSEIPTGILSLDFDDVFVIKIFEWCQEPSFLGPTDAPKDRVLLSQRRYTLRRRLRRHCHQSCQRIGVRVTESSRQCVAVSYCAARPRSSPFQPFLAQPTCAALARVEALPARTARALQISITRASARSTVAIADGATFSSANRTRSANTPFALLARVRLICKPTRVRKKRLSLR
eukprot:IDg3222t1